MSQGGNLNPLVPMTGGGPLLGVAFLQGYPLMAATIGVALAAVTAGILFVNAKRKSSETQEEI
ncbi:hypothetical protein [Listeria booriae]|uniref:Uncharacterized protein n=1 Tax=Listeria booriae TaxID=1552123 RepID=A0A099W0I5_9LIST|nr:hypothetical protein [Listeria booriae]KGL37540.1 hypothetical protein EP57_16050 [Listeria booriae]MBC1212308.1 hypothetical protein [Listeria booriae]MBC1228552.1 hypothetical protein [Listeria booriae]MBC1230864.1 hypothetical protein [Listeria booriae]MBC1234859.1 hypothetical protein [Listeria booriae]